MELELGLAPPNVAVAAAADDDHLSISSSSDPCARGKRCFREAFQQAATLPLFDDGSSSCRIRMTSRSTDKKPLVGWPPVSSARSRACESYVKVKKEGDAIVRKVDLSLHASYDQLLATLRRMFPTTTARSYDDTHVDVVVTYEDGEGDWMLLGDVPWDDFATSVKRLKILG